MKNFEKQRKKLVCLLLALSMLGTSACGLTEEIPELIEKAASAVKTAAASETAEAAEAQASEAEPEETIVAVTEEAQPEKAEAEESQPEEAEMSAETQSEEASAAATPAMYGTTAYALTETGTFEIPASSELICEGGKLAMEENDIYHMISLSGAQNNSTDYLDVRDIDVDGYVMVTTAEAISADDVNCWGLVSPDGEEILPCEAAAIEELGTSKRFVVVYYATEETAEDDDEALLHLFSMYDENGNLTPRLGLENKEGDRYYKGYRRIFDVQTKTFFNDLTITSNGFGTDLDGSDTLIAVQNDGGSGETLYAADGTELAQSSSFTIDGEIAVFSQSGTYYVYDENGERFSSKDTLRPEGEAISQKTDEGWMLLDYDGNQLTDLVFENVYEYHAGIAWVEKGDNYQLVNIDSGEVLDEVKSQFYSYVVDGYWTRYGADGGTVVIGPEGIISEDNDYIVGQTNLCVSDGSKTYLVLSTGETAEFEIGTKSLTYAMIAAKNSTGNYAVFDLFTGEVLTDCIYDDILYSCGCVYAVEGTTCHVFEVSKLQ